MAVAVLDVERAVKYARDSGQDEDAVALLSQIARRKHTRSSEMSRFADLCDRWDNLYYPNDLTEGGPDHWPEGRKAGQAHVSINSYPVYVDVPAALQAATPIENILAPADDEAARDVAAVVERLFFAWKDRTDFDLKAHQTCVVKGLYGRGAGKVYWDDETKLPAVSIVDQPRNLWLGWSDTNYRRLDWALYCYRINGDAAYENFGVEVQGHEEGGQVYPIVRPTYGGTDPVRAWLSDEIFMVEVYDYWYKKPVAEGRVGRRVKHETWNAIFVGNIMVKNEVHPEYDGQMPYVPVFNTYIPGVPDGRSEFYDINQLIAEKDQRMSAGATLIKRTVSGQYWQVVGQEAPEAGVHPAMQPKPDQVVSSGPGNRLESIVPWMPEFQLEAYLNRVDRELVDVSGLNDLLRGLAPAAVLSSSKAISALVANYETRIAMKRGLFYVWRREMWSLARKVWAAKQSELKAPLMLIDRLEVLPPSLTPRDDLEAATMARNLVDGRLWSQARAMDRVGVDDPEQEQNIIRSERTDATMFPADVQVLAQLLALLRNMGMAAQPQVMAQGAEAAQTLANVRTLNPTAEGMPMLNAPGEQPVPPPETAPSPPGGAAPGQDVTLQTALTEGVPRNRILQQQRIQSQGGG